MGDFMLTEAIAERIALASDSLVAPIIPFGYADYFRPVPGGISLRPETFRLLLEDICLAFFDHGVERLVILNGHSGNAPIIDQSVRKLKMDGNPIIPCLHLWRMMPAEKEREIWGEVLTRAKGHGADPLTSVYHYLFPHLLRMDLYVPEERRKTKLGLWPSGLGAVRFNGFDVTVPIGVDEICVNGVVSGDPALASAEIGQQLVNYLVEAGSAFIRHFKSLNKEDTHRPWLGADARDTERDVLRAI